MAKINWTKEAEQWLQDIHDYIALDKPTAAQKTVKAIYEHVQLLQNFPSIGYRYLKRQDKHIRVLLYGHYRIAYLIKDDGSIDILGVFHGSLDLDRFLL